MIRALAIVAVMACSSSPSQPIDAAPTCPARDPTCGECTVEQTGLACPYAMTTGLTDTCTCVNLFGAPPTERAWLCSSCPWTDATNQPQACTAAQEGVSCMWAGSAGATGCSCECVSGSWTCTAESADSICPS